MSRLNQNLKKSLAFLLLFTSTLLLICYVFLIPHDDFFYDEEEEIIEYQVIDRDDSHLKEDNAYNFSFDGLHAHYKIALKRMFESQIELGDDHFKSYQLNNTPIVLWWTPFTHDKGVFRKCSSKATCFFTNLRKFRDRNESKAILFYGTDLTLYDLPLPRNIDTEDWALLHEESPKNNYLFSFEPIMRLFNHTATFKRESDMTLITQGLSSISDIEDTKYLIPTSEKNRLQREENLAPVAYIQSDCYTPSDRDIYVQALMKHIKIDSYGKCLHNKDLPPQLANGVRNMNDHDFYKIVAKYKFVLAMENAVCDDYVTEKLWRPYYVGSVPIVYGSSRARDLFPTNHSAIEVLDFKSPKDLADYLNFLNQNDTEYNKYLGYKTPGGVRNKYLIELMNKRGWGINNDQVRGNFINHFECMVCERLHENKNRAKRGEEIIRRQANKKHFGCPEPYTFSEDGTLLDSKYKDKPDWKESSFKTSFEMAYIEQKLFLEKYYSNQPDRSYNLTYKKFRKEVLDYFYQKFLKNKENIDL